MHYKIVEKKTLLGESIYEIYYAKDKDYSWHGDLPTDASEYLDWVRAYWAYTPDNGDGNTHFFVISEGRWCSSHTESLDDAKKVLEKIKKYFINANYEKVVYEE